MDLDNLIGEVEGLADEYAKLKEQKCDLGEKLRSVCISNFEKIVLPYAKKMDGVLCSVRDKADMSPSRFDIILTESKDFMLKFIINSDCVDIYFNHRCKGLSFYLTHNEGYKKLNPSDWERISDYFLTEEKAYAFLDELAEVYYARLDKFRVSIGEKNKELANAIQRLEDVLKGANTPKEKEDGSVEFHINGKTYIGTVKEE